MAAILPTVTDSNDGLSTLFKALFGTSSAGLLGTGKTGKSQSNAITDAITKAITDTISKSVAETASTSVADTVNSSIVNSQQVVLTDQITKNVANTDSISAGTNTSKAIQDTLSGTTSASTVANTADTGALRSLISTYSADNMKLTSQEGVDYQTDRLLQGPLLNFINAQNQSGGYGGVNPYLSQIITDAAGQGAALSNQAVIQGGQIAGNAAAALAGATKTTTGAGTTDTTGTNTTGTTGTNTTNTVGTNTSTGSTTGSTNTSASGTNLATGKNITNTTGLNTTNNTQNVTADTNNKQIGSVVGATEDLSKTPINLTSALTAAGVTLAPSAIAALAKSLGLPDAVGGAAKIASKVIVPDGGWTDALGNVFDKAGQVISPAASDIASSISTSDYGAMFGDAGGEVAPFFTTGSEAAAGFQGIGADAIYEGFADVATNAGVDLIGGASTAGIITVIKNIEPIMEAGGDIADFLFGWL